MARRRIRIVRPKLSHIDKSGAARMVDVSAKDVTEREAVAEAWLLISPPAAKAIETATLQKGDAVATARLAGITAAKRTHELIPLCHPLRISSVNITIGLKRGATIPAPVAGLAPAGWCALQVISTVRANDRTGVEMEALTASSVAALTLYDMLKAIGKDMILGSCRLLEKRGGKSGDYRSPTLQ